MQDQISWLAASWFAQVDGSTVAESFDLAIKLVLLDEPVHEATQPALARRLMSPSHPAGMSGNPRRSFAEHGNRSAEGQVMPLRLCQVGAVCCRDGRGGLVRGVCRLDQTAAHFGPKRVLLGPHALRFRTSGLGLICDNRGIQQKGINSRV